MENYDKYVDVILGVILTIVGIIVIIMGVLLAIEGVRSLKN